ncbi:hypothetical protein SAMN04488144_116140 [Methylobacterium sp. 190mf]|nr:hypothetical protein SAMN04488144_116140 [Methylobacterium sp. 190mf]
MQVSRPRSRCPRTGPAQEVPDPKQPQTPLVQPRQGSRGIAARRRSARSAGALGPSAPLKRSRVQHRGENGQDHRPPGIVVGKLADLTPSRFDQGGQALCDTPQLRVPSEVRATTRDEGEQHIPHLRLVPCHEDGVVSNSGRGQRVDLGRVSIRDDGRPLLPPAVRMFEGPRHALVTRGKRVGRVERHRCSAICSRRKGGCCGLLAGAKCARPSPAPPAGQRSVWLACPRRAASDRSMARLALIRSRGRRWSYAARPALACLP